MIKLLDILNEVDPKKGTGKKPKGSGRRLYTDENPSDTVSIKFKTAQDIKDTLSKESFKSKTHARQSQIINLIHQRVRAAYSKAKDSEVKARLKRALDYIEKRKEASKAKTQRLNKIKETSDPQSGKAAPYGSGYKKLDEELNEVGEANLTPYKWKEEDVDGYWTYVEFTTDEGTEYNVGLEVMNYTPKDSTSYVKALNVEFATIVKDIGGYSYSTVNVIINKGELYRVMSTIAAIVKHYVKKYKIQAVIYSPSIKTG
jgi:hypothetical protein